MKDFSRQPRVVEFTINGDVFRGKPFLAAQTMIDFTLKMESVEDVDARAGFQSMMDSLEMVLMPDSYKLFRERMRDPGEGQDAMVAVENRSAIEMDQVNAVLEWITEEYGMRPTKPSSDFSDGPLSLEPGTNSTAPTSGEVSISVTSPSTAS